MKADKELKLRAKRKKILDKIERIESDDETKLGKSKRAKRASLIGRIFIIAVVSCVFLFLLFNINYLTPSKMKEHMSAVFADMGSGEGFPYRFSSDDILDFFSFSSSDTAVLTNNDLLILNSSACPVLSYKHSMSYPIVKASKDRILLYDQGSSKAVMLNQSGQILKFENENTGRCLVLAGKKSLNLALFTSWFSSAAVCEFEGLKANIPEGWQEWLKLRYGDYMRQPITELQDSKISDFVTLNPSKAYTYYKGRTYCV